MPSPTTATCNPNSPINTQQPVTIHLSLSPDFKSLCTCFQMKPAALLQLFIDHFSVCAEMLASQHTTHSLATSIFVHFKQQRKEKPIEKNDAKRVVDIHYISQVAGAIGKGKLYQKEGRELCNQLIDDWYEALYKLNQPLHNNENNHTHYLNKE